jgi:hypothetical protein
MTKSAQPEQSRCTNCGGSDFESGWVHQWGYNSLLRYSPFHRNSMVGLAGSRVTSRRCLTCNQITFFCDQSPMARFSLRALLIAMTLVAIVLGLAAWAMKN